MTPRVARRVALVVLALLLALSARPGASAGRAVAAPQLVSSQTGPTSLVKLGTAVVLGRVLQDDTGEPVVASSVCMWHETVLVQFCELTDEKGRFLYRNVPAGRYHLRAEPGALAAGDYGQTRPWGPQQLLEITEGARLMDVVVKVFPIAYLSGVVVDEAGEPVVGADVNALIRLPSTQPVGSWRYNFGNAGSATTDDRGAFKIGAPPAEDYFLMVESSVFATVSPTAAPDDVPIVDRFGRRPTGLSPGPLMLVDDLALRLASGWRQSAVNPPPQRDGKMLVYPTTFYPSALRVEDAAFLGVRSGEQRGGLTITLRLVPGVRVSGRLTRSGQPVSRTTVTIRPAFAKQLNYLDRFDVAMSVTDRDGRFVLAGVPAGEYVVVASESRAAGAGAEAPSIQTDAGSSISMDAPAVAKAREFGDASWASRAVSVGDGDVRDLDLELQRGVRASGEVHFDGKTPPSADRIQRMSASLRRLDSLPELADYPALGADGHFATGRYPPGQYALSIGTAPAGWTMRSATWQGHDLTGVFTVDHEDFDGVVVTFSDRLTSLSGAVTGDAGADRDAYVVIFPVRYRNALFDFNTFTGVRAATTGTFEFKDLRPGEYFVAAIPESRSERWMTAETLDYLASVGTRVTLTEGERTTQNLRTVRVK